MSDINSSTSPIETQENVGADYDFDSVKRIPFYFGSEDKPLLGWLHTTDSKQHSNTGVIICPPLAVEYMNSYRSMRYVADYFALAGIPALRFDYHGTGDSSGVEEDEDRLESWQWSIDQAIEQLKTITGCTKYGLFGFRIGATLAALVAERIPVEFLILWATLNSGKKYIREIKLIQKTGKIQSNDNDDLLLEAGGMGYWEQTANDISKINLMNITPRAKRILVIPRDEQTTDTELYDVWKENDLCVDRVNLIGSTLMLVDAHLTVVPHQSIQDIVQWVQKDLDKNLITNKIQTITQNHPTSANINHASHSQKIALQDNSTVKESILYFGAKNENIAILTETDKSKDSNLPTVLILNSGANHRVGPSRLYVSIARELSLMGFRCLRIDVPGIGDSIISSQALENIEYINSSSHKILEATKALTPNPLNNDFILMGLCSGAYFSFHAALELSGVTIAESILINPLTFYWEEGMTADTSPTKDFSIWNWYKHAITNQDSWIKLIQGKIDYKSLATAIQNRIIMKFTSSFKYLKHTETLKNINKHREQLPADLIKITDKNIQIQFILSRSDPGHDILMTNAGKTIKKLQRSNKIDIKFIEDADHTFSKYKPRRNLIYTITQHFKEKINKNN